MAKKKVEEDTKEESKGMPSVDVSKPKEPEAKLIYLERKTLKDIVHAGNKYRVVNMSSPTRQGPYWQMVILGYPKNPKDVPTSSPVPQRTRAKVPAKPKKKGGDDPVVPSTGVIPGFIPPDMR